jgi:uncharacterized membrane protein
VSTGSGTAIIGWLRIVFHFCAAILALALPVVVGTLFMGLPDIDDDQEEPKFVVLFTVLVAIPVLIWVLLRTDGHLAGTRRRWLLLTLVAWAAGLALPAYGYFYAIRGGT